MTTDGAAPHVCGSATVHALLLCIAGAAPRQQPAVVGDQAEAMRPYLVALEQRARATDSVAFDGLGAKESSGVNDSTGNGVAGGGEKHEDAQGAMGATLSREREKRRWSAPRKPTPSNEKWDGQTLSAADFGIIGLLGHKGSVPIRSAGERALSKSPDPVLAQGAMWAPVLGTSLGNEASGLTGTGIGAGGTGEGVGLGNVGDLGHTQGKTGMGTGGAGSPELSSAFGMTGWWGDSFGTGLSGHRASVWRSGWDGGWKVSGRLPPEAIQRVVRDNFGRFRLCYEKGLFYNPSLAGRVSTRFAIGGNGQVLSSSNDGADLPDAAVVSCITQAFSSLAFPQPPDGSQVTVVYPITFQPVLGQPEHLVF